MSRPMSPRQWLPLIGMTLSAFIFNTSEFMPVGLLTDIAAEFQIGEAAAGMLISVYAWAVMLLSLPLMVLVCRMDFRRLLLAVTGLFAVCQFLSAASPSYPMLMLSRIGVACAHAVFWSIASPAAVQVADEEHRSMAMSMIVTGTSVAMIFGLPLGRMVGLYVGWRMTFALMGGAALVVLAYLAVVFPRLPGTESFTWKDMGRIVKAPPLMGLYLLALLFATAYYTGYGYIEPFLKQVAGMADGAVTAALTVFGACGLIGSFLFSKFYERDRWRFLRIAAGGVGIALLLLRPAAVSPVTVFLLCAFWGIAATLFNVTFQFEVIRCAPEGVTTVAMSIYSGIYNLGIGCGTWLGGLVCTYASIGDIGFVGGALGLLTGLYCALRLIRLMKRAGV